MSKSKSSRKIKVVAAEQGSASYEPTAAERELAQAYVDRLKARVPAPRFKIKHDPPGAISMTPDHPEESMGSVVLRDAFGATEGALVDWLLGHLINATHEGGKQQPVLETDVNGALAAIHGIAPRDETEALLATQMVATHFAAMVLLRRLHSVETLPQQNSAGSLALKLLRTYTAQVEVLARYRGKGQQTVRVEYVNVEAGGQAIVGSVSAGGAGGAKKSEEQPHARQIVHAHEPPLRSPDQVRDAVPIPRRARKG